jgi:hypothetical protein
MIAPEAYRLSEKFLADAKTERGFVCVDDLLEDLPHLVWVLQTVERLLKG